MTVHLGNLPQQLQFLGLLNVQGAVMVTLKKGEDLPSADPNGYSDPYVKFKLNGNNKKSTIKRFTINPAWNEKFEWFRVRHVVAHCLQVSAVENACKVLVVL